MLLDEEFLEPRCVRGLPAEFVLLRDRHLLERLEERMPAEPRVLLFPRTPHGREGRTGPAGTNSPALTLPFVAGAAATWVVATGSGLRRQH